MGEFGSLFVFFGEQYIYPTRSFNWPKKSLSFHWIGPLGVKYMAEWMAELGKQQCAIWRRIKHIHFKELFEDKHINDHQITVHFHYRQRFSIVRCVTLCWDPGKTSSNPPPSPSTLTGETLYWILPLELEQNPEPCMANMRYFSLEYWPSLTFHPNSDRRTISLYASPLHMRKERFDSKNFTRNWN